MEANPGGGAQHRGLALKDTASKTHTLTSEYVQVNRGEHTSEGHRGEREAIEGRLSSVEETMPEVNFVTIQWLY